MKKNILNLCALLFIVLAVLGSAQQSYALNLMYLTDPAKRIEPGSSVLIVSRDENRTVVTITPRFTYEGENFGVLIPVPQLVSQTQVKLADAGAVNKLLKYTAPRLKHYEDQDICTLKDAGSNSSHIESKTKYRVLSTSVEVATEQSNVEISLLKNEEFEAVSISEALKEKGLFIDKSYDEIIDGYKETKVDYVLLEFPAGKESYNTQLPAIQIAYESENFALPIGLSGHSSTVAQDLTLIFMTRDGMISPKDVPVKKMVSDVNLPMFVSDNFDAEYEAIYNKSLIDDNFQSLFLEYSGDVGWCPTCNTLKRLTRNELRSLGVWWLDKAKPTGGKKQGKAEAATEGVFITRLHLRHTDKTLLNSVEFVHSKDKNRFVTSYKVHKPYLKTAKCELGRVYKNNLMVQYDAELDNYTKITGAAVKDVKAKMEEAGQSFSIEKDQSELNWWERMWDLEVKN